MSAMVSAMDDAIGNLTVALRDKGIWNRTVFVFSGDNGGPQQLAHWNAGLRGGKWTHFEGGVRPAAFVYSQLLPPNIRGTWHNATMHLVDWVPTFLNLAGLGSLVDVAGLDGFNQWPALVSGGQSLRRHTLITHGVLVSGNYKLFSIPPAGYRECGAIGRQGWDCLLGTGGGWMSLPSNSSNVCPSVSCARAKSDEDRWLCSGACISSHPCLYDVVADPGERINLASAHPEVVQELTAVLAALDAEVVPPHMRGCQMRIIPCARFLQRGGEATLAPGTTIQSHLPCNGWRQSGGMCNMFVFGGVNLQSTALAVAALVLFG